ncbi:type VI secretion system Vgr family protein [Pendulispora albinea]|uniref:Type VI secretion system tip protein VgrG n=1 Tax=Pendulispora albinea TaxID=2741071 RepID=A0ABZ2MBF9_9BACT
MNSITSMFESSVDTMAFRLRAGKHDESALVVAGFEANEKLSELFRFDVDAVVDPEALPSLDDTLGRDAEFQILRDDKPLRIVRGMVEQVTPKRSSERQRLITLRIVPKLAELQYTSDSRIFQDLAVHEIVAALVQPHDIELEWRLDRRPKPRPYRVQKDETDYDFFRRILADAGIHFHFLTDDKSTKVVFVNDPRGYTPIEGDAALPFRETAGAVTLDHVGSLARARVLRPGSVVMRDYDFMRSGADLTARAELDGPHDDESAPKRELYLFPGDYIDPADEGKTLAMHRLEEARSGVVTFHGTSSCARLEIGRKFKLEGHPDEGFNQELFLTELRLRGQRAGILADTGRGGTGPGFTATFWATPSAAKLQPVQKKRPYAPPESARVVGPEKGSPFVDTFGRVKVQFFWDRDGKWDEKSSCWLRVMTPAAGGNRGIWFPPRVGDEVIVNYLNGDIDRPFVAGAIYNAQEPQPDALPADSSKSSIKSLTIPGGKGFNAMVFEDLAGKEEIFLHAQKDRRTVVLHNHTETVGANQTQTIGANQTSTVGANRSDTVGANETVHVKGNRTETVDKKESVTVHKGRTHTVSEGDDVLTLPQGHRTVNVQNGNLTHNVRYVDKTEADFVQEHGRFEVSAVGDKKVFLAQEGATYTMEKQQIAIDCPSGSVTLKDKTVTIDAVDEIVLQCGRASISLKKDGTIAITGSKEVTMSSSQSFVTVEPAKATVNGPMTDVVAKAITKIVGALVKIN